MRHGNNRSPWVEPGWLWASAGSTHGAGLVALDPATGKVRGKSGNEVAGYAAPMVGTLGGVRQVVDFMAEAAVGFEAQTGRVLWRHPLKTAFSRHVMTPLLLADRIILGSHQTGLLCLQVRREGDRWSVSEAWNFKEAAPNFSCPIVVGDRIVGLGPQREVVCIGHDDGTVRWTQTGWITSAADKAHAGFIAAGDARADAHRRGRTAALRHRRRGRAGTGPGAGGGGELVQSGARRRPSVPARRVAGHGALEVPRPAAELTKRPAATPTPACGFKARNHPRMAYCRSPPSAYPHQIGFDPAPAWP